MKDNFVVYRDDRYVLGLENGNPFLSIEGKKYELSCQPFEPCLYISFGGKKLAAVRNSFDPSYAVLAFSEGKKVTSITGLTYDAPDFCRMLEYAARTGCSSISEAEEVFGGKETANASHPAEPPFSRYGSASPSGSKPFPGRVVSDETFNAVLSLYVDCVVDYCLVKIDKTETGEDAHRMALALACEHLFFDGDEPVWLYDISEACPEKIAVGKLFGPIDKQGKLNYRKAFICPPYGTLYTDKDFDKVNSALFPKGTSELEVFEWTTDWSEYFDDGNEWWGTLCLTVHDRSLDRFAVILASATD